MDAKARNLNQIFDGTISFQIPLFQRPYVWSRDNNWEPLWEDIQELLDSQIVKGRHRPHFLGAVVLEQMKTVAGSIESHQVIDGQQRFTTLQLFMLAARDICKEYQSDKFFERFNDLVANKASKVDFEHEKFKVWPTNRDRTAFKVVHEGTGAESLKALLADRDDLTQSHRIIGGYLYFSQLLGDWVEGKLDDDSDPSYVKPQLADRLEALWQVIGNGLQVVVINLDDDDESQVIFETLNARGTQLLPADLIKNYLFRRAQSENKDIESLYEQYWKPFDDDFWREEVKHGRVKRPRIDTYLQHYLTLMLRDDVRSAHLFESFKSYVHALEVDSAAGEYGNKLTQQPKGTEEHLKALHRYARAFRTFAHPPANSRLMIFLDRLEAVDTTTVYPLLLLACDQLLPNRKEEFDSFLGVLESYLIRRMVCGLTTKNYNKIFVDVIKALDKQGEVSADALERTLHSFSADSNKFPTDEEFEQSFLTNPSYQYLAQYKIRAILAAIDLALGHSKSEVMPLPDGLTIEHIMPVKWHDHWSIPQEISDDPEQKQLFRQTRNKLLHSFGNLTLITGSLNPALSNSSWEGKRPELVKFSKLNLNRYFHKPSDGSEDGLEEWNEDSIMARGKSLLKTAKTVWPYAIA
jgi:hypothetical protein